MMPSNWRHLMRLNEQSGHTPKRRAGGCSNRLGITRRFAIGSNVVAPLAGETRPPAAVCVLSAKPQASSFAAEVWSGDEWMPGPRWRAAEVGLLARAREPHALADILMRVAPPAE